MVALYVAVAVGSNLIPVNMGTENKYQASCQSSFLARYVTMNVIKLSSLFNVQYATKIWGEILQVG